MILAFDTATRATTVALASGARTIERRDDPPPGARPRHTTVLLGLIAQVLADADAGWDQVERIAVGVGPGTFTGLRIGVATARALASARGLPLVGISTLESLARNATPEHGTVAAVLDARRGEVFAAIFNRGELELPPSALTPGALAKLLAEQAETPVAIGDGAIEFRAVLEPSGALIPEDHAELHRVTAINHCVLARQRRAGDPSEVLPHYLRLPDAEITRRSTPSR
ncbi:MAG TPA: tRNA (adenosine(37)-N6)-threonylcarbamoyltransferase complex dimerization subunit type 1 TsaB [Solirubrobacteraceae bacterium]|jgi:tRNA threonylcarbamoyladenosine biosynthesis protein TsaB|nr:tRNA (adenosine(37)-N6)-threonylcarbamoyltransferase complex dimerization subunit type 1 TsaB [Solirubrobacteraceae bacterium]